MIKSVETGNPFSLSTKKCLQQNNYPIVAGAHNRPRIFSSKEAKGRAILFALKEASNRGFSEIVLVSNAKEVVEDFQIGSSSLLF